jgi:tetratricopeptide (TPR) repeat protein
VAVLGDLEAQRGELGAAVDRYEAVLHVHATHPHAALGLAEARLRQGRDLPRALASLEAVEADRDSPPALRDRLRFDLALARLLAAAGRTNDAVKRLTEAAAREPADPRVAAAQAEVLARAGELDRAIRSAEGAVRLAPTDPSYRELLAKLQLRRGLYRELLAGTAEAPTRTLRLDRGIARLALGEPEAAIVELQATRRDDGKTTPEAAAWMALADLASGRREQASSLVAALLAA